LLLNKGDLLDSDVRESRAQAVLSALQWQAPWFLISALSHEGTWIVAQKVMAFFDAQKAAQNLEIEESHPWSPLD
jgi:GTP-binding protein